MLVPSVRHVVVPAYRVEESFHVLAVDGERFKHHRTPACVSATTSHSARNSADLAAAARARDISSW